MSASLGLPPDADSTPQASPAAAAAVCGALGEARVQAALLPLLQDESEAVRESAQNLLLRCAAWARAAPSLLFCLPALCARAAGGAAAEPSE
jgi:hypothetical protein